MMLVGVLDLGRMDFFFIKMINCIDVLAVKFLDDETKMFLMILGWIWWIRFFFLILYKLHFFVSKFNHFIQINMINRYTTHTQTHTLIFNKHSFKCRNQTVK